MFRPQAAILRCSIMPNLLHLSEYCPFHTRVTKHFVIKMLQLRVHTRRQHHTRLVRTPDKEGIQLQTKHNDALAWKGWAAAM
jgi:hypothetical protein